MSDTNNNMQPNQIKSEITIIATRMLEGEIDLIEGCRQIVALQHNLHQSDKAFLTLRGVDSETDHIPIGAVRNTWAPEALKRLDAEKEQYLNEYSGYILDACKRIITILS